MKKTVIPFVIGELSTAIKGLVQGQEDGQENRTGRVHPNCSIIEICQNTKQSSGNLRRLVVTQTPV